jgi:hypothetical protein
VELGLGLVLRVLFTVFLSTNFSIAGKVYTTLSFLIISTLPGYLIVVDSFSFLLCIMPQSYCLNSTKVFFTF